jgi:hypothetical protein
MKNQGKDAWHPIFAQTTCFGFVRTVAEAGMRRGVREAEEDFFEMANLFPADTGLPMVVWVSERGHARHDVRVKVNQSHGTRMLPGNLATVSVRPAPRVVAGNLSPADLSAVSNWIGLNEAALVDYWEYRISTAQLIQRLQRLPASGARP